MVEYKDVAKRAKMIAEVTADRYMPPWPADPHYRSFVGERSFPKDRLPSFKNGLTMDVRKG